MANTKITSDNLDTLTTLTIDDLTLNGSTISGTGDITLDAVGDIILDADGDDIKIAEGGTVVMEIKHESSSMDFLLNTGNDDFKFKGSGGGVNITALQLDMSEAGKAIFNAGADFASNVSIVTNLSSDTTTSPDTVLTLATKYSSTGADGGAGAGPRLEFKIPDDETNPITGAAIAGVKEDGNDSVANAALVFYTSQDDTTLDEAMRISSDASVGINMNPSGYGKLSVNGTGVLAALRASSGAGTLGFYEGGAGRFYLKTLNGSDGLSFVDGDGTSERMKITADGTLSFSDPNSGNYVASFGPQNQSNAINVGPYVTLGTDYSGWQTRLGWNARPKIGTTNTGFEAATSYHAAGAAMFSLGARTMDISFWTPTEIAQTNIGSGYSIMSTASSGVTTIGSTSGNITDNYVLRVQTQHGYGRQGSHNSTYFHHETDRTYYYWNEAGYFLGGAHSYSDESLKKDITLIPNALDSVAKMNGVTFKWKDPKKRGGKATGEGKQFGVIAQNMLEVDPELPTLSVDPLAEAGNEESDDQLYSMNYDRLSPYFIEAIKELKTKLEAAEARITELENG